MAVLISIYPQGDCDKSVTVCIAVYGCAGGIVSGTLYVIGVALLGQSSFEFDTIQGNG